MSIPDASLIIPYMGKLLKGIKTEEQIDPVLHCQVFKLNCESQEYFEVQTEFQTAKVYYGGHLLCQVRWLPDGVEFLLSRETNSLVYMMRAVLITITELQEGT